jgi:CRP-like cAMP-binding protein
MLREELAHLPLFEGLSAEQLEQFAALLDVCYLTKGRRIFEQGDAAEYLYILLEGEVLIRYKPYDGDEITVARVMPGGVFGWSAALGRATYTSSVVAVQDGKAYCLRAEKLQKLCDQCPETGVILLKKLAEVIAQRVQVSHEQVFGILSQGMDSSGDCMRELEDGRQ